VMCSCSNSYWCL